MGDERVNRERAERRRTLETELTAAERRLRDLGGADRAEAADPIGANVALDDVDVVQDNQAQEIGLTTRERLTDRVRRLTDALARLDRGEYGRCVDCGRPIPAARLRAIPDAETCVDCQQRREREAARET